MNLEVGVSIPIQCVQLAILTGHPSDAIKDGHSFAWGKGMFRVESINGAEAIIRRLASHEIKALDQANIMNPSQFRELDAWQNPGTQLEDPTTPIQTGAFVDPTNKDHAGGDVIPKDQVYPKELKSPRPAFPEPTPVDSEVRNPSVRMSAIQDSPSLYEGLKKISNELATLNTTGAATAEAEGSDVSPWHAPNLQGYGDYEAVLKDIVAQANAMLADLAIERDFFLNQRNINPKELE